jgi:hypothetical protein
MCCSFKGFELSAATPDRWIVLSTKVGRAGSLLVEERLLFESEVSCADKTEHQQKQEGSVERKPTRLFIASNEVKPTLTSVATQVTQFAGIHEPAHRIAGGSSERSTSNELSSEEPSIYGPGAWSNHR